MDISSLTQVEVLKIYKRSFSQDGHVLEEAVTSHPDRSLHLLRQCMVN